MDHGNLAAGYINIGVVVVCLVMGELARVSFYVVLSLTMGELVRVSFDFFCTLSGHGRVDQSSI